MLNTKDNIFLSFGLYQVSYICFELKKKKNLARRSARSSDSDLGFHTRPSVSRDLLLLLLPGKELGSS